MVLIREKLGDYNSIYKELLWTEDVTTMWPFSTKFSSLGISNGSHEQIKESMLPKSVAILGY